MEEVRTKSLSLQSLPKDMEFEFKRGGSDRFDYENSNYKLSFNTYHYGSKVYPTMTVEEIADICEWYRLEKK